jgi:hypothetical protein
MRFSYLKIYDIIRRSQAELEETRGAFREAQ